MQCTYMCVLEYGGVLFAAPQTSRAYLTLVPFAQTGFIAFHPLLKYEESLW